MTIRFAAPPSTLSASLDPSQRGVTMALPANDNDGLTEPSETHDALLRAALRHFAEHGLAAAQRARRQAEKAFFAGDRQAYQWWLGICRTLDRRLAAAIDFSAAVDVNGRP